MATLTTSYQKIGTGGVKTLGATKARIDLYAKYNSQSTANNTTNWSIEARLVITSGSYIGEYSGTTLTLSGDGISSSQSKGTGNFKSQTLGNASGTTTHNADGTKSVTASASMKFSTWGTTLTVSGSATLPTIPRYANITNFTVSKIDETSVRYGWNVDATCDWAQYSTDNGATWYNLPPTNIVSGLSANTTYKFKLKLRRQDSQLWTESNTVQQSTYAYPYCISAPDFTIGDNATFTFYNPLNRTIQIQMWSYTSQQFVSDLITTSGTSYTGFSDIADRLYASIPNSKNSQYSFDVHYGTNKSIKVGGYYSIRGDETPIFEDFDYEDTNSDIINLTGNNQILVDNYSTCKFSIPTRAIGKNSATIDSYICYYGDNYITYLEQNMSDYWKKQYEDRFNLSFDINTNINEVACNGAGGWECLYFPIRTVAGKTYKFTFDYRNPNGYTPLSGQAGISCQILTRVDDNENTSNQIAYITLNPTANQNIQHLEVQFTATTSITYINFNFGYAADGVTTTIYLGNFKLNDINGTGNILKVQVIDSRGLSTIVTKTITNIPYKNAFINELSTERKDGVDSKTFLAGKFTIYNGSWDGTNVENSQNRLKYVGYSVYKNNAWSNYYDITNAVVSAASVRTDGNNKIYEFDYDDDIQIHENGTSGGFTLGKEFPIKVLIKDGNNSYVFTPTNYQALLNTNVSDGTVATCLHKDSNGLYHFGINCMSNDNYMVVANDNPIIDNDGKIIGNDIVKLVSVKYGQSLTIPAHGSVNLYVTAPTIPGYTFLGCVGGAGEGLTGLLVSATVGYLNTWLYNTRDNAGTWSNVEFVLLYVRSI